MCLCLKDGIERTANKPIKVYKVLTLKNTSIYYSFKYEKGLTYRLGKKLEKKGYSVYKGFHSYTLKSKAKREKTIRSDNLKVCTFIVPRGAKYYEGLDDDIVSTSIRLIE